MIRSVVIGISGATCSGKTTLARILGQLLPQASSINQDDYYHDVDDPRHEAVASLGHLNWEIVTAFDMERLITDIKSFKESAQDESSSNHETATTTTDITWQGLEASASGSDVVDLSDLRELRSLSRRILIVEGITIFNHAECTKLFDMKYFLTLDFDECQRRRRGRTYDPPDVPGYFEQIVWPHYKMHLEEVRRQADVVFFSGREEKALIAKNILTDLVMLVR